MSRLIRVSISLLLLLLSSAVFAEQKIAVINVEKALNSSAYAKTQFEQLQNSEAFKTNLETYDKLRKEFEEMQEDARVNSVTWSDQQKQEARKNLEDKVREIDAIGQQLDRQKMIVGRDVQKVMAPFFQEAIKAIISEQKLDLVLKDSATHFHQDSLDLTDELISYVDKLKAAE